MSYRIFQLFPIGNPAYNYCVFDFVGLRIQKINIFQVPTYIIILCLLYIRRIHDTRGYFNIVFIYLNINLHLVLSLWVVSDTIPETTIALLNMRDREGRSYPLYSVTVFYWGVLFVPSGKRKYCQIEISFNKKIKYY